MQSDWHFFESSELRADIALRIDRIQQFMKADRMDALLVSGNSNIFYTSGAIFRGYVYIPAQGSPVWLVMRPAVAEENHAVNIRKPELMPEVLQARGISRPTRLGMEFATLSHSMFLRLSAIFKDAEIIDASPLMSRARMVKTPYEIHQMRVDGAHQTAVYRRIAKVYREGMSDVEFQIEIERELRREGALGYLRVAGNLMELNMGSVLAGENADAPGPYDFSMGGHGVDPSLPVGANGTILRPGMAVMVDMNGNFNGYQTDLTRVWTPGKLPAQAYDAHQVSLDILHELERIAVPGASVAEITKKAYHMAEESGFGACFMGHHQKAGFIGHGVGIELNEGPVLMTRSSILLEENMTIAIEPKFVIPEVGAVGAENTYVVTPGGLDNLTPCPEGIQMLAPL